ncbi:MAG: GspH/FimT family pseudopilin [Gemmatimonadaceae bacterium]|nr:GspH/FimT family pseudopilin [Gemmatimonadaceae bacterium]
MTHQSTHRATRRRSPPGFTLIELLMVVAVVGIMMAVLVPRFRISPETEVQLAAMQMAQDIDLARTRALSTRSTVRVKFVSGSRNYTGFLDDDNNSTIGETQAERDALRGFATRTLPARIDFNRGSASAVPDDGGSGAITFAGSKVEFDSRGLTLPMGVGGVVYLKQQTSATAVAAVAVSPSGQVRLWTWHNGAWQ